MENSVAFRVLSKLKSEGKKAYIIKKNGHFFNGEILLLDEKHVQIADRVIGPMLIAISEIAEARESVVGGKTHD